MAGRFTQRNTMIKALPTLRDSCHAERTPPPCFRHTNHPEKTHASRHAAKILSHYIEGFSPPKGDTFGPASKLIFENRYSLSANRRIIQSGRAVNGPSMGRYAPIGLRPRPLLTSA